MTDTAGARSEARAGSVDDQHRAGGVGAEGIPPQASASLFLLPVIVLVPVAFLVAASEDGRVDCRLFPGERCRVCAERAR